MGIIDLRNSAQNMENNCLLLKQKSRDVLDHISKYEKIYFDEIRNELMFNNSSFNAEEDITCALHVIWRNNNVINDVGREVMNLSYVVNNGEKRNSCAIYNHTSG